MEGPSEPKAPRKSSHAEPKQNYDKSNNDTFLGPYEPNNAEFQSDDVGETVQEAADNSATFDATDDTTAQNDTLLTLPTDQPLPPAKYGSVAEFTEEYWKERKQKMTELKEDDMLTKSKNMSVPMARVKKIMRIDDEVRHLMIASDAPIFMAQAAEFFIEEMTGMGWQFVSESRRRILQRNDIGAAVRKNDQFDFLIDFLPQPPNPNMPTPLTNPIFMPQSDLNKLMKGDKQEKANGKTPEKNGSERRKLEERRKKEIPPHKIASDRFKCVMNKTASGNEFQIMEMPRRSSVPTTSGPSTSSTTTTSAPSASTVSSRRFSSPRKGAAEKNGSQKPSTSTD